ncbi:ABC transporter substrate-binding protein [Rhodobacteraceae bacterium NNCM2]|nr:ABC transporter substrate-binding protein [Coraliihabitans acroporae]
MTLSRRSFLFGASSTLPVLWSGRALALSTEAAEQHVAATVEAILHLIVANLPREETARRLRRLFVERSALEQLVRFTSGTYWQGMTAEQQARYTESFASYISSFYARQFRTFDGTMDDLRNAVRIAASRDAGRRGILVTTEILASGRAILSMDWLVSDRSGRVAVSDLIVGGISMAKTQRDVIVAMFEARGGDPELMIAEFEQGSIDK